MAQKLTNEEIDQRLMGKDIKRIGEYQNARTPILFKCLIDGCQYKWLARPDNILNGERGCPNCAGVIKLTNQVIDNYLVGRNITRIDNYINARTPLHFKCTIEYCDHIWLALTNNIIYKETGCSNCAGNAKLTNEIIDRRLIGRNIERVGNYINSGTPIIFKCTIISCKREWGATTNDVLNSETGCPVCSLNKSETIVSQTLREHQIKFEAQKSIKFIITTENSGIRVDFYIPEMNTIIEYNGKQHYEPVSFFEMNQEQAEVNFVKQQARDLYLTQFCANNDIILIWIDGRKYNRKRLKTYIIDDIIPQLTQKSAA